MGEAVRDNVTTGTTQKVNDISGRLAAAPGRELRAVREFAIESVEVAVGVARGPQHALLVGDGCRDDTAALALLLIEREWVRQGAGREAAGTRLTEMVSSD